MNKFRKLLKWAGYFLILVLFVLAYKIFVPRTYSVPSPVNRTGTKFWNLSTGSKIAYTEIPPATESKGISIIFLQGGPGGPIYNRNIESLSVLANDGYDVYLYDQVGCGFSNRLENVNEYTTERHVKDLHEIVQNIKSEKIILLGQSWGALLACLYVAEFPERIEKIILTGPGPVLPIHNELRDLPSPDSLHLRNPASTNAVANRNTQNIRTKAMAFFAREFGWKIATDEEADNFQTILTDETNKSTVCDISKARKAESGGGFYCQVMTLASFASTTDIRPKLKTCKIPVLIMKGQCDNQFWGFTSEYLELFQNHQLVVIPDAGHSISIEQPEAYIKSIREFLDEGVVISD